MSTAPEHAHVDLEMAADFDAGILDTPTTAVVASRVATCPVCRAAVERIRTTTAALRGQPPVTMPPETARRLVDALAAARAEGMPRAARRIPAWAPYLVAAAVALVGLVTFVTLQHPNNDPAAAASPAAAAQHGAARIVGVPASVSGTDYGHDSAARLQQLVTHESGAIDAEHVLPAAATAYPPVPVDGRTPDPASYGHLFDPATLDACAASLSGDSTAPLFVDYGLYDGHPAAVLLFRSERAGKLDAFVVTTSCGTGDSTNGLDTFVRLDAP